MIVLGLDGALGGFSAALLRDAQEPVTLEISGQIALEQGLSAVSAVLAQAHVLPRSLDRIGVGIGPGSFTGARIAISFAKSLAQGWKLPLVGVNSFDSIEAGRTIEGAVLTVVRGRKGVISVRLRQPGFEQRASGYIAAVLDQLAKPSSRLLLLGHAEDVLPGLAERGFSVQEMPAAIEPSALAVATAAAQREPAQTLHEIRADYGELPAASIPNLPGLNK